VCVGFVFRPWLPYRFPRGRFRPRHICPSFPTDFPAVGCETLILRTRRAITPCRRWRWNGRTTPDGVSRASVSTMATPASIHARWSRWPTGYRPGEVFDREPRGLVRRTPFHAMYATRSEL